MYEMTQGWEEYYEELETEERREIFERLLKELPDDGLHGFREEVHKRRYPKQGKRQMDIFLLNIVYFPGLYSKKISAFSNVEKEIKKACIDMGLDQVESLTEEQKNVLYWELHNAADLYFSTCRDAGYGRKLFGIMQSSDDDRAAQVCSEAWILAKGIPALGGNPAEMQIFTDAVLDSYFHFDKKAEKRFLEYEETQSQRMNKKKRGWFWK